MGLYACLKTSFLFEFQTEIGTVDVNLTVINSCFVNGNYDAPIVASGNEIAVSQETNYVGAETVTNCSGILFDEGTSCFDGSEDCLGDCFEFMAETCQSNQPTSSPTYMESKSPTKVEMTDRPPSPVVPAVTPSSSESLDRHCLGMLLLLLILSIAYIIRDIL